MISRMNSNLKNDVINKFHIALNYMEVSRKIEDTIRSDFQVQMLSI